jgi:hypothetical protein
MAKFPVYEEFKKMHSHSAAVFFSAFLYLITIRIMENKIVACKL